MAFNFTGKSKLYHSFCDNQVILHMKPQVHVAGGCMTCISHCPQPGAVHKYCLHNTEHIFNFMLIYDKEKKLKASSRTVWNLLIVSHTINLSVGSKSPFQVEALQAQARRGALCLGTSWLQRPQGRGEAARNLFLVEGHVGEVDEILLDFELKGAGLLSERHKVEERSEEAFCRAGWLVPQMEWVPWATLNCSTKPDPGAAHILLALPLFLVALISSLLPWPSDLPGWRKQSDCLE